MLRMTRAALERWAEALLHIHDTPKRTAAAFGIGVVIGFSPLVGLHNALGIAVAFVFNLNRVAVLAGIWLNLPWFLPPFYAATTALGAWLVGAKMPPHFLASLEAVWSLPTWLDAFLATERLLSPLLVPYVIGSTVACLPMGYVAYRLLLAALLARRRLHARLDRSS